MGTRADFYVTNDGKVEASGWLGSIAWDGYDIPDEIKNATDEDGFISEVEAFLVTRDDATLPKDGWPWPWNNSDITDYAYVFDGNKCVWDDRHKFPDMSELKNVARGSRSGLIIISSK